MCDTIPGQELEQIEAVLKKRLSRRVMDLRVLPREGGVSLRGYAFSYHAKQLAQHAAMQVGLCVLVNEIEVRRVAPTPGFDGLDAD
jgi:hypothetical protein